MKRTNSQLLKEVRELKARVEGLTARLDGVMEVVRALDRKEALAPRSPNDVSYVGSLGVQLRDAALRERLSSLEKAFLRGKLTKIEAVKLVREMHLGVDKDKGTLTGALEIVRGWKNLKKEIKSR